MITLMNILAWWRY